MSGTQRHIDKLLNPALELYEGMPDLDGLNVIAVLAAVIQLERCADALERLAESHGVPKD